MPRELVLGTDVSLELPLVKVSGVGESPLAPSCACSHVFLQPQRLEVFFDCT